MDSSSPVLRRSFSLPPPKSVATPDPQVEVLFTLPSVRIVAFTTSISTTRYEVKNGSPAAEDKPGTLPWVSRFERTIAVGPLRIYRAPGSVAFLNCANALQPILPKSQSWCVDGDSKFVLQIRRPQYWRIEVPNKDRDEHARVEQLKVVLSKVLLFEKTPCPFQRDFVIELPEAPQTPVVKRPWRPSRSSSTAVDIQQKTQELDRPSPPNSPLATPSHSPTTPQRYNPMMRSSPPRTPNSVSAPPSEADLYVHSSTTSLETLPEDEETEAKTPHSPPAATLAPSLLESMPLPLTSTAKEHDSDDLSEATDDSNNTPRSQYQPEFQPMSSGQDEHEKPPALATCVRSTTAPPLLSLITSPPSKGRTKSQLSDTTESVSGSSYSSSEQSFHSIQSWHSPPSEFPKSSTAGLPYPYPHENIILPKRAHTRKLSEATTAPGTPGAWEGLHRSEDDESSSMCLSPHPETQTLDADIDSRSVEEHVEAVTSSTVSSSVLRHRATTSSNSRRRELSPLPAAVNLFSPPPARRARRLQTAKHLPTAIVQKTCEILLSPPSHLFHLMINIASKIAAGEWRGFLFSGYGEAVRWDFEDEYARDQWSPVDDYGITLPQSNMPPKRNPNASDIGGSWEVD
ncbi:inheritance of peroxisomes protein 1-domain-containing protein [Amylocarpus encephaloides]|uniref:Inheritance of peroxisomes protein 1 n=1 Tax=Amylocarpus encephaloides TaxID=45428 RepID=A0A9P7Y9I1_9HELO|nr:inheritance of peroxisomes protein 1-domain-containing protein [Amylocarpus encephaloides]